MKRFFLLALALLASCVTQPARAQVNASVAMDKTNSWLRSTNFIRSNWFAGSGITFTFGTNGSLTISASGASGQPASANLTNWSNIGTNEVVYTNTFRVWTNTLPTTYQASNSVLTQLAGVGNTNLFIFSGTAAGGDLTGTYPNPTLADAQLLSVAGLSYGGNAGKVIAVNGAEDGFELVAQSGGSNPTNTFNANQFTLTQGTNVNFSFTALITNLYMKSTLEFTNSSASANEKRWKIGPAIGNFAITTANDAGSSAATAATFSRSGDSPAGVRFFTPMRVDGALTNDNLTAGTLTYANADKVLSSVTITAPMALTAGTLATPNFVGDSGSGGTAGLVPAPAAGDAAAGKVLKADGTWATAGAGTVTSVAASSDWLTVSGSPVTTSGTITLNVPYIPQLGSANLTNWSGFGTNNLKEGAFVITNKFNSDQFVFSGGAAPQVNIKSGVMLTNAELYGQNVVYGFLALQGVTTPSIVTADTIGNLSAVDVSTKGQFVVGDGAGSTAVVTPGSDNLFLMADSATGTGYSWNAIGGWPLLSTNMLRTVTNNFSVYVAAGTATNVVDMSLASSTNILNGALTMVHATNGVSSFERTHVRWLWAGGADRAFSIPSTWKTNVYSAVPANITNGTITKMYVTTIGDTSSSANQTNVFVSFEFYK